jgi:centromere protein C
MNRTRSRTSQMEVGTRTGLTVPSSLNFSTDDGLENPEQLFDAVMGGQSSIGSLDGSSGKENDTTSVRADTSTAAVAGTKKPKIKVRFSLGDEVADQFEATVAGSIKARHPVRKLITGKHGSRESIDTMDLSSVSTAPSLSRHNNDEESYVEASRQSSEEIEIAAIVAAATKQTKHQQLVVVQESSVISKEDDVGFYDDSDDLVPPPPPDSPQHEEEIDEEDVLTQPVHDNAIDFPNSGHDDDNDAPGFEMHDDDDDDVESDRDEIINEQRRRKEKRMENLSKKAHATSSANGKKKKYSKPQSIRDESESDDADKPKPKTKKKINPYKTTFSPKGMPGPRTFTKIPLSDLKADSPEDTTVRRSKRARTAPLEFWRGEKPVFGGNDFGDEFDGLTNMPMIVAIEKPDPTPYKKRKIETNTKRGNKTKVKRTVDDDDTPVVISSEEPFDSADLRRKLPVNDGKVAHLWDERFQETRGISKFRFCSC